MAVDSKQTVTISDAEGEAYQLSASGPPGPDQTVEVQQARFALRPPKVHLSEFEKALEVLKGGGSG